MKGLRYRLNMEAKKAAEITDHADPQTILKSMLKKRA
jgi:hypothetical protein